MGWISGKTVASCSYAECLLTEMQDVKIRLSENGSVVVDRTHVIERTLNGMVAKRPTEAL